MLEVRVTTLQTALPARGFQLAAHRCCQFDFALCAGHGNVSQPETVMHVELLFPTLIVGLPQNPEVGSDCWVPDALSRLPLHQQSLQLIFAS